MEKLNIAVVSSDEEYSRALCVSLLHACRQLQISSYTSRMFLQEWSEYDGLDAFYTHFDLILWAGEEIGSSYGDNIVYLADKASLVNMDYENHKFALYKYSSASDLVSGMFDIYSHLTGRHMPLVKRDGIRVFAFASYCGGSGCTTLARAVSQDFSRFYGKRVLYLSLEDIDSMGEFIQVTEGTRSAGEFLYHLLGKKEMPFLDSYLVRDDFGVRSFAPAKAGNPLNGLSRDDMQELLSALMDTGEFDVITVDISTCLTEAALAVIEPADRLCLIARSPYPGFRENNYMKQMTGWDEQIRNKILRIENMAPEAGQRDPQHLKVRRSMAGAEGYGTASLEGDFGIDISYVTAELITVLK